MQNYNLETSLNKAFNERNTLKNENEQLRLQLSTTVHQHAPETNRTEQNAGYQQSIKQKFNPFMLAKNIVNKVEQARIIHNEQQQHQMNYNNVHGTELEVISPTSEIAHRLETQEIEFFKTNETLRNEINLLQLQLEQSEATNKHLREQVDRLETVSIASNKEVNSVDNTTHCNRSQQLQQSLEIFATSIQSRVQKIIENNEVLVQSFISSLENRDSNKYKAIESITNVITEATSFQENDFDNTTEDFKLIWHFFEKLNQTHLNNAKTFIALLCHSFVDYDTKTRHMRDIELTSEREKHARLLEQMKQHFAKKIEVESLKTAQMTAENVAKYKENLEKVIVEQRYKVFQNIDAHESAIIETITKISKNYQELLNQLNEQIQQITCKFISAQNQIELLQNKINESVNERKISEKRGFKIIKELKKQLNSEKNRADKLQSILNSETDLNDQLMSKSSPQTSPNNFGHHSQQETAMTSDKGSSSGSWSYMNDGSSAQSPNVNKPRQGSVHSEFSDIEIVAAQKTIDNESMPSAISTKSTKRTLNSRVASASSIGSITLEQENVLLVARVSNLQQEKWCLEEQINHLELEIQRLLIELSEKNKLIQHYCIEGRSVDSSSSANASNSTSPTSHHTKSIGATFSHSTSPQQFVPQHSRTIGVKSPTSINNSVLRVVNYLKEKSEAVANSDSNSAKQMSEVNRKLQRMVEEILTKNMHLQANLEQMSDQLMDLKSRLCKYESIE